MKEIWAFSWFSFHARRNPLRLGIYPQKSGNEENSSHTKKTFPNFSGFVSDFFIQFNVQMSIFQPVETSVVCHRAAFGSCYIVKTLRSPLRLLNEIGIYGQLNANVKKKRHFPAYLSMKSLPSDNERTTRHGGYIIDVPYNSIKGILSLSNIFSAERSRLCG